MKQTNILFILAIFIGAVLSSCSSSSNFTKRKYFNFKQDQKEFARATPEKPAAEKNEIAEEAVVMNETAAPAEEVKPVEVQAATPAVTKEAVKPSKKKAAKKEAAVQEENVPAMSLEAEKLSFGEKLMLKQVKKIAEKQQENGSDEVAFLILIILAILLPPLAVLLVRGVGLEFLLSLLLWFLFILPGIIYALYIVIKDRG